MPRPATAVHNNLELGSSHPSVSVDLENITIDILLSNTGSGNYIIPATPGTHTPFEAHDHTVPELFIVEDGTLNIDIGEPVELHRGEMLLIKPRTTHRVTGFSENGNHFSIRFSMRSEGKLLDSRISECLRDTLPGEAQSIVFRLIKELRLSLPKAKTTMEMYRLKSCFGMIISYVIERFIATPADPIAEVDNPINLYTKIENYLYLNYGQQLTLESLAAHLSYSRTQMRRILDACYGMPFTQKLREIRLNAAKKHLCETDMSIDEIAEKCGYETRQGFESMFLKYVGTTPNKYRKTVTK